MCRAPLIIDTHRLVRRCRTVMGQEVHVLKFFHLSDLHIGLRLLNYDLREDQEYILGQIIEAAASQQPQAVVIAGDIYDKAVPSAEAVEVFDHFISGLTDALPKATVMIISGNHDSGPRLNCFRSVLSRQNVHMIGLPPQTDTDFIEKIVLEDTYGKINFYLLPFVRPSMVRAVTGVGDQGVSLSYNETLHRLIGREQIDMHVRNVLVSHQFYLPAGKDAKAVERMDSEIRTIGNIDQVCSDVLEAFDYAALGHIHKPMSVGRDVYRYCGTPLACSVSEAGQQKGIVMVDMKEKGTTGISVLPLKPLRQVRILKGTLKEVLAQGCEDYVSVTLTDNVDLDVFDMQDRLRAAFPRLLEIRRQTIRTADYSQSFVPEKAKDPLELCRSFLKTLGSEEEAVLKAVINKVQEGGR